MTPTPPFAIAPRRCPRCLVAVLALLFVVPSAAQDASPFRDLDRYAFGYAYPGSQLKDHIYERSRRLFAAGDAQRDGIRTVDAVRQRQRDIRRLVIAGIGGLTSADTPLNPRVTGTVEGDGFRIEKIVFESRPRHYVTANLYLPLNRPPGRTAAVLFLSGHHNTAKVVPEYQSVCQTLVRAGLIVLAQDPVGQGERLSYFEPGTQTNPVGIGTRDHDYAGAQGRFLGDTLARYLLHDAMRGIDYLISRPEVDAAKHRGHRQLGRRYADEPRDAGRPACRRGGAGDVHHEPRDLSAHGPAAGRRANLAWLHRRRFRSRGHPARDGAEAGVRAGSDLRFLPD